MRKLANINSFESLQAHANRSMGMQSEMAVFNIDDDELDDDFDPVDEDDWEEEDNGFGERPPEYDSDKQKQLEDKWDCHSYLDMMHKSNCVLANFMGDRIREKWGDGVELISGRLEADEEVFQWFIVENPWFIQEHTYEPLFYDEEYDVYVLGVTNFGTHRSSVPAPQLKD